MSRQRVKSQINLEELAGGAFAEKLNEALMQGLRISKTRTRKPPPRDRSTSF